MSGTNITSELRKDFDIVTCGAFREQLALVSCFVDGKPTAAICLTEISVDRETVELTPIFVRVTPDMVITDHDGNPTTPPDTT